MEHHPNWLIIEDQLIRCMDPAPVLEVPEGVQGIKRGAFLGIEAEKVTLPASVTCVDIGAFACCSIDHLVIKSENIGISGYAFDRISHLGRITAPDKVFRWAWKNMEYSTRLEVAAGCLKAGECPDRLWEYISRNFDDFLDTIVENGDIELLTGLLGARQKLRIHRLERCMSRVSGNAEMTALVLQYRNQRYSAGELERKERERTDKELGILHRTTADWREIFDLKINGRGATIMGWYRSEGALEIPEKIGVHPVIAIHDRAFMSSGVTHLHVPGSVRRICPEAFSYNSELKSAVLGEGLKKIRAKAFRGCIEMTSVTLPESLRVIENKAFSDCPRLEAVKLPEALTGLGAFAFFGCDKLREVCIPGSVKQLPLGAFTRCRALEKVILEDGVEEIGESAFERDQKLIGIRIPASVKHIGRSAFSGCHELRIFTTEGSYACQYAKQQGIPVSFGDMNDASWSQAGYEIIGGSLVRCIAQEDRLEVPEGVTELAGWVFSHARWNTTYMERNHRLWGAERPFESTELTVTLPSTLKTIGESAFNNNHRLQNISIPPSVESIGESAFKLCIGLKRMEIPPSVREIGRGCFEECDKLSSVSVPESTKIGPAAFVGCKNLVDEDGFVIVNDILFGCYGDKREVVVPDGVHTISERAFEANEAVSITLPASVRRIGRFAFDGCWKLEELNIAGEEVEMSKVIGRLYELKRLRACWSVFNSVWQRQNPDTRFNLVCWCLEENLHLPLLADYIREQWVTLADWGLSRQDSVAFERLLEALEAEQLGGCLVLVKDKRPELTDAVQSRIHRLSRTDTIE